MTSRKGRRTRRAKPLPVGHQAPDIVMPFLSCPHCEKQIRSDMIGDYFQKRRCPRCGESLDQSAFYKKIADLRKETQQAKASMNDTAKTLKKVETKVNSKVYWWQKISRWFALRKLDKLSDNLMPDYKRKETRVAHNNYFIHQFEQSAYYASDWFQATHFLLNKDGGPPIDVEYNGKDNLELKVVRNDQDSRGIPGEFEVFDQLIKASKNAQSPLYGCYVVPNTYFPVPVEERGAHTSFWRQIDCLVLTTSCAFVIEVKNWRRKVYVDAETGSIWFSCGRQNKFKQTIEIQGKSYALSNSNLAQNADHAYSFYRECRAYPYEHIYEATLFWNPKSFLSKFEEFDDNNFAGAFGVGGVNPIAAMEAVVKQVTPCMSNQELTKLARRILQFYGDLNQKRAVIHKRKLCS